MSCDSDAPGAARKLQIESLDRYSVTLAWQRPEFDGGSPITGYYVERRQGYSNRWGRVNRNPVGTPMITIQDLVEGDEYEFRIVAENEAGVGQPSASTGMFTARDPVTTPGRPGKPGVTLDGDSAKLLWTPPANDDGRGAVTHYVVEWKASDETGWKTTGGGEKVTRPSYTVTGLRPDVEYQFRVSGENLAGLGQPSTSATAKYGETPLPTNVLFLVSVLAFI